jgi:hypothetical protein
MSDIETAMKIAEIPNGKVYMQAMQEEIENLRQRLYAYEVEYDPEDKPVSGVPCPFCGELPYHVQDSVVAEDRITEGWAVSCYNRKCSAFGPVKRYRKPAIKAWETRAKKEEK